MYVFIVNCAVYLKPDFTFLSEWIALFTLTRSLVERQQHVIMWWHMHMCYSVLSQSGAACDHLSFVQLQSMHWLAFRIFEMILGTSRKWHGFSFMLYVSLFTLHPSSQSLCHFVAFYRSRLWHFIAAIVYVHTALHTALQQSVTFYVNRLWYSTVWVVRDLKYHIVTALPLN